MKLAVIGAGHLGNFHIQKLLKLEQEGVAELAAIVECNRAQHDSLRQRYGKPLFNSLSDVHPNSLKLDAVIIATPTDLHEQVAMEALDAGLHILVEKPIAHNSKAGIRLSKRANNNNLVLQVGHSERFNPAVAASLPLLTDPRYIVTERLAPFSGRSTDIDVVLDLMIHDLDIVASLIPFPLTEVRATGVPIITNAIDMAAVRLTFDNGAVAQLSAGRASIEPSRKIRIFSAARYLSIDCATKEVKSVLRQPPDKGEQWATLSGEEVVVNDCDALESQSRAFIDAIKHGRTPLVDAQAGVRALQLAEQINEVLEQNFTP